MPSSKRVAISRQDNRRLIVKEKKTKQAKRWLKKQVSSQKPWTSFFIPIERIRYVYNLNDTSYATMIDVYNKGKTADETAETSARFPPKNVTHIRQDIIATILIFEYDLLHKDFIVMKRLATARNRGVSAPSSDEISKWPARPDVFLHCNTPEPNGISDDKMVAYLLDKKYGDSSDSGGESEIDLERMEGSEIISDFGGNDDGENVISEPQVNQFNPRRVPLLKDMYLNYGEINEAHRHSYYRISRSKYYDCRNAVKDLSEGKISGVTPIMFEETFDNVSLMNMPMMADKRETIKLVTSANA